MRNTAMVIRVGNGNMLDNIINADGVRQMRNTAMLRSSIADAILMLMARVRQMRNAAVTILMLAMMQHSRQ